MSKSGHGLPCDLGEGLLLRWAGPSEVEKVADYNVRTLSDNPQEPEEFVRNWTRDLMSGRHPSAAAHDVTVVVDLNDQDKIVSSLCLISQTWRYGDYRDGIDFGCGRVELVSTDPAYRRRGLVQRQFEAVHAKSSARGELVQAITGIPWFYRQFGYDMAVDLGGGRRYSWNRRGNFKPADPEIYQCRPVEVSDFPLLMDLYPIHAAGSPVTRVRSRAELEFECFAAHKESPGRRNFFIVETSDGQAVGYFEYDKWGNQFAVREIAVIPGHSLRAVGLFVTRHLKVQADELNRNEKQPVQYISFQMGASHPIYHALEGQLEEAAPPYAWYLRVADVPGFVRHIKPVLERRLANSVMAGHTGTTNINFYQDQMSLVFEQGQLKEIGSFKPDHITGGDAVFADHTFLQLLFGYRTHRELRHSRVDSAVRNPETGVLFNILFPKHPSLVNELG